MSEPTTGLVAGGTLCLAILTPLAVMSIRDWRSRRRAAVLHTLFVNTFGFGAADGRPAFDPGRRAEEAGWTVQDMTLFTQMADPRWKTGFAAAMHSWLGDLTGGHIPGDTAREAITWLYALLPPGPAPELHGLEVPDQHRSSPYLAACFTEAAARRWHHALGVTGAYAVAAGLTFDEAWQAHRAGTLDPTSLATLAALRGHRMPGPGPAHPEDEPTVHTPGRPTARARISVMRRRAA